MLSRPGQQCTCNPWPQGVHYSWCAACPVDGEPTEESDPPKEEIVELEIHCDFGKTLVEVKADMDGDWAKVIKLYIDGRLCSCVVNRRKDE